MADASPDAQAQADRLMADLLADLSDEEAVYAVAVLVNRAATELHRRVRAGAGARRGEESWAVWAGLQNVSRNLVLQSSTCRDSAASLVGRKR